MDIIANKKFVSGLVVSGLSHNEIAILATGIIIFAMATLLVVRRIQRSSHAKIRNAQTNEAVAKNQRRRISEGMKRVEIENRALQQKLNSAQKLVKQVMAEGGKLLDTYHLDYSDIDFGGDDEEDRCKLGEGAQVICASCWHSTQQRAAACSTAH